MKNPKYLSNEFLLKEEVRLVVLIDRLKGIKFMRSERGRASLSLRGVQSELSRRGA